MNWLSRSKGFENPNVTIFKEKGETNGDWMMEVREVRAEISGWGWVYKMEVRLRRRLRFGSRLGLSLGDGGEEPVDGVW